MRVVAAAVFVVLLAGCLKPYSASSAPVDRRLPPTAAPQGSTGPTTTDESTTKETAKRVADKREPDTLIADDGSRCFVTDQQYAQTRVGTSFTCPWTPPAGKFPGGA